jgi:hypothetical protein
MGLCNKCREILPPHIMFATNKGEQVCAFCKTGKGTITLVEGEGDYKTFTKPEMVGKYKEFIDNVLDSDAGKRFLIKDELEGTLV